MALTRNTHRSAIAERSRLSSPLSADGPGGHRAAPEIRHPLGAGPSSASESVGHLLPAVSTEQYEEGGGRAGRRPPRPPAVLHRREFKDHLVRSRCPAAGLKTGPTAPITFTTGPGSRPATVRLLLLCEAAAVPAAAAELLCSARP
ncbi:hypothetical protein [Kitasatospora cineracea]|uniref:Uncharacterized protein n=1 Tax=Kitasatospora cineracea TaxID=88074 RepID=A0A3N4RB90_9ACTN|nr:hypothetical protein [Kitasatospora cineracea]RPE27911.1 hypothetical protein EDD38_7203 [Kitasatospora cineracea]